MRQLEHTDSAREKILHIRAIGCRVNVLIGTHDPDGYLYTTVEVIPDEPDDDGVEWAAGGESTVVVRPRDRGAVRLGDRRSPAPTTTPTPEKGSADG